MKTERLLCERGNHAWTRTSARGRKPKACPDAACATASPPSIMGEVTESEETTERSAPVVTDTRYDIAALCERMETLKRLDAERLRNHRKANA